MATIAGGNNPENFSCHNSCTVSRVYSGLSNDICFLKGEYQDKGLVFWDIPFSLVADTVFLPYTVYTQAKHGNLCDKEK